MKSIPRPAALYQQPPVEEPATRVLRQFRQIFNAVKTHFRQVEKQVGLGGAQVWALGVIRATPDIGVSDLAQALNIHQSTASNLVKGLVERELIEARKDDNDRRASRLRLLPSGLQVLKSSPGPLAGVLPEALAQLDDKVLRRLERDLGTLIAVLEADESGAGIPLADL